MSESESRETFSRRNLLKGAAGILVGAVTIDELLRHANPQPPIPEAVMPPRPAWEQDFSQMPDGPPDPRYWNVLSGANGLKIAGYSGEAEAYTDRLENVRIENGLLILEARKEDYEGKHYTSGRVNTQGKFGFVHGKIELVAKIPKGKGTWPAFWSLPSNPRYKQIESDPKFGWLANGEIDVMESVGAEPGYNDPDAHNYSDRLTDVNTARIPVLHATTQFHTYSLIKTPNELIMETDGNRDLVIKRTSNNHLVWPYEQAWYPIINLAIGGPWAGESGIDNSSAPWKMEVKSLRYYLPEIT